MRIGSDTDWKTASAGSYSHTVAVKTGGTLWAWGLNSQGQLGDGTTTERHIPVQIGTESNWQSAVAGDYDSAAMKTDGSLWAWGGIGRYVPAMIGIDMDWQVFTLGTAHIVALKTDNSTWAWGSNMLGGLGLGITWQTTPLLLNLNAPFSWSLFLPAINSRNP